MENCYCNLKCIHCGVETPLAESATGHAWESCAAGDLLARFVVDHGNCYLLDGQRPTGHPFTLSYGAKKEPGVPVPGELPLTDEQKAWFEDFKKLRNE